ncbi:hypothetical protein H112_06094 [Trichophyton rubrum D6]|uniref:Uncharacterized protein n=2 Tax=Trichophyton TaxID=5550 RepID=A0A022VWQ0_TRIRU|nr:hypothetical protein H100_06109 [Trichophyton rubrum MR850]EZF39915.1 hypothetical protein H102_06077 [Trichophyton rubrum CBS 100081]EZF50520.1 hypothetical protein H103_06101 [Trichophyton rubrum CBS 288.86]EZF61235.1 hypothetical protein H104_06090 [Trichophyton rubrum CBS 289.86]EZF71652.1 hypothetical protein H105_06115 [Trichophyton soudanense CBS 452.61]EZF82448.1 hypothetical protein H110_06098 [Trichophyton rubrum MR1448]EZG14594.1 hypothetical protein H107_06242 [Trichophyton rub
MPLSALKRVLDLVVERMVVESLIENDTLTLEEALEAIFDIIYEECEAYCGNA